MNQRNDIEEPIIHGHHEFKENSIHLERDDDGFLSINSFMDADDFSNEINLEESRWEFDINMICIKEYVCNWEIEWKRSDLL